jgi:hypothetical protein
MFLPAANSCRGPQFAWDQDFLKMFLLRHATVARRDTFLLAPANFFLDPQTPRVSSFDLHVALQLASGPYAASIVL